MKKAFLYLLWILFAPALSMAQAGFEVFSSTGTLSEGVRTLELADGSYIAISNTNGWSGQNQAYILHLGQDGTFLGDHAIELAPGSKVKDVVLTAEGHLAMAGITQTSGEQYQGFLLLADTSGQVLTDRDFGGPWWDFFSDIDETADSGFVMAGLTYPGGSSIGSAWVVRTDRNGDTLWTQTMNLPGESEWQAIVTTSWGYAACGWVTDNTTGLLDVLLAGFDDTGDTLWTRVWGGAGDDWAYDLTLASDGSLLVCGSTASFGALQNDGYILKTDSAGNEIWKQVYPGSKEDRFMGIAVSPTDSIAAAGITNSFGGGREDYTLYLTDANGGFYGGGSYGGTSHDYVESVTATSDGAYILTGSSASFGQITAGMYIVKTDHWGISPLNTQVIVTIAETAESDLRIYPNPVHDILYFEGMSRSEILGIRITDLGGRTVLEDRLKEPAIDLSALPRGMYILTLTTREGSLTSKVVKD